MMMRWNGSKGGRGRRDHVTCHVESDDVRLARDHRRSFEFRLNDCDLLNCSLESLGSEPRTYY